MILTKEVVNILAPRHGKTSCSDNNMVNGFGGWTGKYDQDTGKKVISSPYCNRCYLLDHLGSDTDNLEFEIRIFLYHR